MKNWSVRDEVPNGYNAMRRKIYTSGGQCSRCPSVKNITVDHIIPRHLLLILGFTDAHKDYENLQLLCMDCNKRKGNQLDYTNPKTIPLLKHYMNQWIAKHEELEIIRNTRKITARCLCCTPKQVVTQSNIVVTPSNIPKEQVDIWKW